MFATLIKFFFGCTHRNTTFPISLRRGVKGQRQSSRAETYVVCLDCGREFPYNWEEMRMLPAESRQAAPAVAEQVSSFSVTE